MDKRVEKLKGRVAEPFLENISDIAQIDTVVSRTLDKVSDAQDDSVIIEALLACVAVCNQREAQMAVSVLDYLKANEKVKEILGNDFEKMMNGFTYSPS